MSGWSTVVAKKGKPIRLTDIMSEQAIEFEKGDQSQDLEGEEDFSLSDYELALKLQFGDDDALTALTNVCQNDFELAQYLSSLDSESVSNIPQPADSLMYSKVTVKSAFMSEGDTSVKPHQVISSSYHNAIHQDRKVQHLEDNQYNYLAKHDPLLSALNTSESLSELKGVGDLSSTGLLVNKSVAVSLRTFVDKQEAGESSQRKHNKKKNKTPNKN